MEGAEGQGSEVRMMPVTQRNIQPCPVLQGARLSKKMKVAEGPLDLVWGTHVRSAGAQSWADTSGKGRGCGDRTARFEELFCEWEEKGESTRAEQRLERGLQLLPPALLFQRRDGKAAAPSGVSSRANAQGQSLQRARGNGRQVFKTANGLGPVGSYAQTDHNGCMCTWRISMVPLNLASITAPQEALTDICFLIAPLVKV